MRRESGFTLIEMMIAIGLTAILVAIAAPALDSFVTGARQTGAINDFVSSMHIARSTAIATNSRVTICASASGTDCEAVSWNQGWIVFSDLNSNQAVDVNESIIAQSEGVEGFSIQSGEFGQFLMYRPNGRVMNASINGNSGQFEVCDDRGSNYAKVMIIDLSGRPRTSKYLADGSAPGCS